MSVTNEKDDEYYARFDEEEESISAYALASRGAPFVDEDGSTVERSSSLNNDPERFKRVRESLARELLERRKRW